MVWDGYKAAGGEGVANITRPYECEQVCLGDVTCMAYDFYPANLTHTCVKHLALGQLNDIEESPGTQHYIKIPCHATPYDQAEAGSCRNALPFVIFVLLLVGDALSRNP